MSTTSSRRAPSSAQFGELPVVLWARDPAGHRGLAVGSASRPAAGAGRSGSRIAPGSGCITAQRSGRAANISRRSARSTSSAAWCWGRCCSPCRPADARPAPARDAARRATRRLLPTLADYDAQEIRRALAAAAAALCRAARGRSAAAPDAADARRRCSISCDPDSRHALRPQPDRRAASRPRLFGAHRLAAGARGRRALPAAHRGHRHPPQPAASSRRRSSRTCAGSASTGTARCAGSPSTSPTTASALDVLDARGLIYPCFCTRADIAAATDAPQGPDGPLYPGTCRHLPREERRARLAAGEEHCLRLDAAQAGAEAGPYHFCDETRGRIDGRAAAVRRRRAGAQGHADQLSPRRHGRRSPAGRDPGDARRGPAALDPRARPAAASARLRDAALRPSQAADRRRRPPLRQARQARSRCAPCAKAGSRPRRSSP